jgi:hypothetical protein
MMHFMVPGSPPLPNPSGSIGLEDRYGFLGMIGIVLTPVTQVMYGIVDLLNNTLDVIMTFSDRIVDLQKDSNDVNL